MRKDVQEIIRQNDYLQGQRGDWLSYWQDVANFCLPRKAWITTIKVYGEQLKYNFLYDSRAILALKKSAAGFHSNLTNPASKWFSMRTLDEKFMQSGSVQKYFKEVEDIQYGVMNNSNWNETMLEYYTDNLCFGTAAIFSEEDNREHVRYTSIPLEQINIELDDRGEVCKVYRNFKFTAYQCVMRWGKNVSQEINKAMSEDKPYQKFEIMHYIGPRNIRDVAKKDSVNMEYESIWVVKKEQHVLDESGFVEFPYQIDRFWTHADDSFGYSPAMDVLASIKLVNAQKRTNIRAAMKASDPWTASPAKFWIAPLNNNPSAMNYYDATKFKLDQFKQMDFTGRVDIGVEMMQMEQALIDQGFYIPLFESLSNVTKQMTVPEVQKRIAENLSLVGPVVGRMTKGITGTLLRTYGILDRRLLLPPPPKEIQNKDLSIIYLSPLAKAQRQSEMNGLMTWVQFVGEIAQYAPNAVDNVNVDRVCDIGADLLGVDPTAINERDMVAQIRAKRAELQQQQAQVEMAQKMGQTAKDTADARKSHAEASAVK